MSSDVVPNVEPLTAPELPDPFSKDDGSGTPSPQPSGHSSQITISGPVTDVPLQPEVLSSLPVNEPVSPNVVKSLNENKSLPTPNPDGETQPELYVPGLVVSGLFLPVPNTDPLNTLLAKYITDPNQRPPRDLSGPYRDKDFHTLVMTNSWRSLAKMARDRIVATPPSDLTLILELWYIRLSSLARMRLYNQASAECTSLFTVLNGVEPLTARNHLFNEVLPFELEIMNARVRYWSDDHIGYLDALMVLFNKCKRRAKECSKAGNETGHGMWVERGTRITLIIASQMIEMKDILSAARLLSSLTEQPNASPALFSAIARIYVCCGHLKTASKYFSIVENHPKADETSKNMNRALEAIAYGKFEEAVQILRHVTDANPDNAVAANNLAVALFGTGRVQEGIKIMEKLLKDSPLAVTSAEPWLFNLYVAKWSGDGLRVSSLRLPAA
ncbi:hypothetical protein Clacol_005488 [Clathrus columnatus]|uniref:Trafficking protein particle complex subunit 12 n=1 Tax=Clathrus columnatus TaxID=1419009 RepID=A0AAV5AFJ8_9AGAM|nr:hypothetical protein Clacol_005488 [Clathrus columnatus]